MSLQKNSRDLILDLINGANSTDLSFQEIAFETPAILIDDVSQKNTGLTVTAVPQAGFSGEVTVKYNRISLDDLIGDAPPVLYIPSDGNMLDLIETLNNHFQLGLEADIDVVDQSLDAVSYEPSSISIEATTESLAYTNSGLVQIAWESTQLGEVITGYILKGLEMFPPNTLDGNFTLLLTNTDGNNFVPTRNQTAYLSPQNTIDVFGVTGSGSMACNRINSARTAASRNSTANFQSTNISNQRVFVDLISTQLYVVEEATIFLQPVGPTGTWSAPSALVSSGFPHVLNEPNGIIVDGVFYLMEAYVGSNYTTTSYKCDLQSAIWTEIEDNTVINITENIYNSQYVYMDGYIYKIGGVYSIGSGNYNVTNKCFRYHIENNSWESIADLPFNLHSLSRNSVIHEDFIYIAGGIINHTDNTYSDKLLVYIEKYDEWQIIETLPYSGAISDTALISTEEGVYAVYASIGTTSIKTLYRIN